MWGVFSSNKDKKINRFLSYIDDKTKNLLEWTKYFHHKHEQHELKAAEHTRRLNIIEERLTLLPTESEIRQLIDTHYLNHDVRDRLNMLHGRVNELSMNHQHIPDRVKRIHEKMKEIETKHSLLLEKHDELYNMHIKLSKKPVQVVTQEPKVNSHFKEKLIVNLAKNSKNYVKTTILNLIEKYGTIPGSKIKEMIVDDQKICSKSSLYRILSEIEKSHDLISVLRSGKEKIYSANKEVLNQHQF